MKKETELENLPYTIVGHTSPPKPELSILLTGEGIKAIAERVTNNDRVRITVWSDYNNECEKQNSYQKFTILKEQE